MTSDEELLAEITAGLKSSAQSIRHFEGDELEEIDRFRALGRKAGRQLGWKVRTFLIDLRPSVPAATVYVVVTESNPVHKELMRIRGEKTLRKALESGIIPPRTLDLGGMPPT